VTTGRVAPWIENNLWAILCAVSTGAGGVLIGMTTANHDIAVLKAQNSKLERKILVLQQNQQSVIRNLDRINDKLGIVPPQPLEVME
jgi:hypothetical protein